jgi:hypothetical protein
MELFTSLTLIFSAKVEFCCLFGSCFYAPRRFATKLREKCGVGFNANRAWVFADDVENSYKAQTGENPLKWAC